ncbi:MAG: hypothetical protein LBD37_03075 [Treponema sp.]|jgi:hypothetical protein|nr:hypothetical protein [Treponema sp.]
MPEHKVPDTSSRLTSEILSDYIKAPSTGLWIGLGGIAVLTAAAVIWVLNSNIAVLQLFFN